MSLHPLRRWARSFVGFEGGAGIIASQEYCDAAIWPDDNART